MKAGAWMPPDFVSESSASCERGKSDSQESKKREGNNVNQSGRENRVYFDVANVREREGVFQILVVGGGRRRSVVLGQTFAYSSTIGCISTGWMRRSRVEETVLSCLHRTMPM